MKKENDTKFKYLVRNSKKNDFFIRVNNYDYCSQEIGEVIHNKLPYNIPIGGTLEFDIIRSDDYDFFTILQKDASRLEELIKENKIKLEKTENNINLINTALNDESIKYLIRGTDGLHSYLQVNSFKYSHEVGTAIHEEIPKYSSPINNLIIESGDPEFKKILDENLNDDYEIHGLKAKRKYFKYRLKHDRRNFNKISQALGSKIKII